MDSKNNVVAFTPRAPAPPTPPGILATIVKCRSILDNNPQEFRHPLLEAMIVLLLINLNDLVGKANSDNKRLVFSDHVDKVEGVSDISDLITKCRNAACHIGSPLHNLGDSKFTFNIAIGRMPRAFEIDGGYYGCDFADDVAIYFGKYRLYLNRHCRRAIEELSALYPPQ